MAGVKNEKQSLVIKLLETLKYHEFDTVATTRRNAFNVERLDIFVMLPSRSGLPTPIKDHVVVTKTTMVGLAPMMLTITNELQCS